MTGRVNVLYFLAVTVIVLWRSLRYFYMKFLLDSLTYWASVLLQLKSGRIIDACVQLIRDNYIVVMLPQHNYRLAYAPTKLVRMLNMYMELALCNVNVLCNTAEPLYNGHSAAEQN